MASIQGVYVALFGRPADPTGLAYFNSETQNGADLTAIGDLAQTDEYKNRFEGQSYNQIVNAIYQSLFDRDADIAGLNFFVAGLISGEFTINDVAIRILDGAQNDDKTIVDLKIEAADLYTAALDTAQEVIAYTGDAAAAQGRAFLEGVTTEVPDEAAVDAAVAAMVGGGGVVGSTFTLTTDVDAFVGTNNNDTFQAISAAVGDDPTLNTFDDIDGGAGRDTLNIAGDGVAIPAGVTIESVEVVNIATTVAIADLNSSSFTGVEEIWQVGEAGVITVGAGVTAGFRFTAAADLTAAVVTAADGVSSVAVALDSVVTGGTVSIDETEADDVTSVTVSGSVATDGDVTVDTATATTAVETVNLALTSDGEVTLDVTLDVVTTVDASASTGDLTLDASLIESLEVLKGGSGADTLTADNAVLTAEAVTIDAGAGVDTINFDTDFGVAAIASTLTGGAGGDTFVLTSTNGNLFAFGDSDDLTESLVTITDFAKADDVLDISALGGGFANRTAQNVVNNAVTGAAAENLFEAVEAVAGVTTDGDFSLFTYDGVTYLFGESGGAGEGLDQGDTLVALTGVAVADLTAANFIV